MSVEYTAEQQNAIDKAYVWFDSYKDVQENQPEMLKQVFELTGFAGTGKTTIIKEIINRLGIHGVLFAAYTGKAARVINKATGFPSSTIHSLIYEYLPPDKEACDLLYGQLYGNDSVQNAKERAEIEKSLSLLSAPQFLLKDIEDTPLKDCPLLVLDECSMVNQEMLDDLLTYGIPIIALGDPGQLPPVEGKGALFQGQVDAHLSEIHRQALDNPIIEASVKARKGVPWAVQDKGAFVCSMFHHKPEVIQNIAKAGQVLCGMNKTRRDFNMRIRQERGFDITDPYPQEGELIMCWKNDKKQGLFNGDQAIVLERGELYDVYVDLTIQLDHLSQPTQVKALRAYFEDYYEAGALKRVKWYERQNIQEFDFGYCITVHKAQGSQWDDVVLIDDGLFRGWRGKGNERKQFLYTAVTRAAERFTVYNA